MSSVDTSPVSPGAETETDGSVRRDPGPELDAGATLGRYVVLGRLGAGGMGVVYAAYDPQLDRKVALKLLHAAGDQLDTLGRARLLREAKAMAQLSHPNVVAVHDAGMVADRVYLAMEHVDGQTLRAWLDERARSRDEVLRIFLDAGEGLAAAHAKGLVHRDFKPDNVMIDAEGRVRVMDFGLARGTTEFDDLSEPRALAGHALREQTLPELVSSGALSAQLTRRSAMMGTPAYMAPEQWLTEPVDARTDQFAFCAALYEALYGAHPFGAEAMAPLMFAVLEGRIAPAVSGAGVPGWLRRVLLQGMARDADERHPDMNALLAALRSDPTARQRRWIVAGAAAVLAIAGWGIVQWSDARRVEECEQQGAEIEAVWNDQTRARTRTTLVEGGGALGEATWERTASHLDEYASAWSRARTRACVQPLPGTVEGEPLAARAVVCLDERREALQGLLDAVEGSDAVAVERVVAAAATLPSMEACADATELRRRPAEPDDPQTRDRIAEIRAALSRSSAQTRLGRGAEAASIAREALERVRALGWTPLEARALLGLAHALQTDGRTAEAEPVYVDAYFTAGRVDDHDIARDAANNLVFVLGSDLQRPREAELWSRMNDLLHHRLEIPEQDLRTAELLHGKGMLAFAQGDFQAALALFQRESEILEALLGPEHPRLLNTLAATANVLSALDDGQGALEVLERSIEIERRALGPDHPSVAWTLLDLSMAYGVEERYDEAHAASVKALELRERVYGPEHRFVGHALDFMCMADVDGGQLDRAERECARALEIYERALGPEHPDTAWTLFNLALIARERGRIEEARQGFERSLQLLEGSVGSAHIRTTIVRETLAELDSTAPHGDAPHAMAAPDP